MMTQEDDAIQELRDECDKLRLYNAKRQQQREVEITQGDDVLLAVRYYQELRDERDKLRLHNAKLRRLLRETVDSLGGIADSAAVDYEHARDGYDALSAEYDE